MFQKNFKKIMQRAVVPSFYPCFPVFQGTLKSPYSLGICRKKERKKFFIELLFYFVLNKVVFSKAV